jgi:IS30 family transposase
MPQARQELTLTDDLRASIRERHGARIEPQKIQFALQQREILLSSIHIHHIYRPGGLEDFENSEGQLMTHMHDIGGHSADFQETIGHKRLRVAVFTQVPAEAPLSPNMAT